jgi:rhodanese-related sulfurtransferase
MESGKAPWRTGGQQSARNGPAEACLHLESKSDAVLIDVRTRAEWVFVGMPELSALGRPA